MARADFGGTSSDFLFLPTATRYIQTSAATLTLWDSQTSGTRYTDLMLNGSPVTSIPVGVDGQIPVFQGPDAITQMWADAGGGVRVLIVSLSNIAAALAVAGATTDATIAGRIVAAGSATQLAGDARWGSGVNVKAAPYSATGNGTTDDTAAFTAAITAAGQGGRVIVPPGRYKITSNLTLPVWGTLEGLAPNPGSGGTATTELLFTTLTGSAVGITLGSEAQVKNLVVRGPGYNVGTVTGISGATMELENVSVIGFATGVLSTGGYYNGFRHVEFLRNATGLKLVACYNVDLTNQCRFDCTTAATYGTAINAGTVRGLNIYGGAIESYATGISLTAASQLGLFGVYFESAAASGIGIAANSIAGLTMNVQNCMVYLDNHNIWLRMDGSTLATLTARSNHFVASTGSTTTPTAYYMTPAQDIDISGDNWNEVAKVGSTYADTSSGTVLGARIRIAWPVGTSTTYGSTNNPTMTDSRIRISPQADQTLASNGAVTFNAASENHRCTLAANATSSTVTNLVNGQRLVLTWEQDATGSRTYSWPAICKFTGNSAPSGTAASTRNSVTFTYDSSSGKLYEQSRATAVPV